MISKDSGVVVLTAQGFYNKKIRNHVESIIARRKFGSSYCGAIITTAADTREKDPYNIQDRESLLTIGCSEVDYIDLGVGEVFKPEKYQLIYVCGGNTFRLLQQVQKTAFKDSLIKFLSKGGIYIGVSAGSSIVGPSIDLADVFTDDNKEIGLEDCRGMQIVSYTIFPHYTLEVEKQIKEYEEANRITVTRLKDSQALVISNDGEDVRLIE